MYASHGLYRIAADGYVWTICFETGVKPDQVRITSDSVPNPDHDPMVQAQCHYSDEMSAKDARTTYRYYQREFGMKPAKGIKISAKDKKTGFIASHTYDVSCNDISQVWKANDAIKSFRSHPDYEVSAELLN